MEGALTRSSKGDDLDYVHCMYKRVFNLALDWTGLSAGVAIHARYEEMH